MTAFASGERASEWGTLGCELRSVNHRFLELGIRLPDELRALEPALRERVASRVARGKIDLTPAPAPAGRRRCAAAQSAHGRAAVGNRARSASSRFGHLRTGLTELLQFPGVLQTRAGDAEALQADALALLDSVLGDFIAAREREGGNLAAVHPRARRRRSPASPPKCAR